MSETTDLDDLWCDRCRHTTRVLSVADLSDVGYEMKPELCPDCFHTYLMVRARAHRELSSTMMSWWEGVAERKTKAPDSS